MYKVIWEIDLDADSPREAAQKAREIHKDPGSEAVAFTVISPDGTQEHIDLLED